MRSGIRAVLVGLAGLGVISLATSAIAGKDDAIKLGKERYMKYCATCHGPSATGDGIAAPTFVKKPTNLTLLAKESGGKFPTMKVLSIVKGETPIAAHGTREMPVWTEILGQPLEGDMYKQEDTELKILPIAQYLESIQQK